MQHFEPDALATVLYAVFDRGLAQVHTSSAGHFPPVITRPGQPAVVAHIPTGLMIDVAPGPAPAGDHRAGSRQAPCCVFTPTG
jgi:hypothetical protein